MDNLIYQTVKQYLIEQPKARERSQKYRAIGNLLGEKYGFWMDTHFDLKLNKEEMSKLVSDVMDYDRSWEKVALDNPDLRGTDYKQEILL